MPILDRDRTTGQALSQDLFQTLRHSGTCFTCSYDVYVDVTLQIIGHAVNVESVSLAHDGAPHCGCRSTAWFWNSRALSPGWDNGAVRPRNRQRTAATGRRASPAIRANEMNDQKNTLLFIVLSAFILIGWQIFFGLPQMEKQRQQQQPPQQTTPGSPGTPRLSFQ